MCSPAGSRDCMDTLPSEHTDDVLPAVRMH